MKERGIKGGSEARRDCSIEGKMEKISEGERQGGRGVGNSGGDSRALRVERKSKRGREGTKVAGMVV